MVHLNEGFISRTIDLHGDAGRDWLAGLPQLLSSLEDLWGIEAGEAFPNLTYNYVTPAIQLDGTEAILKVGVPAPHFEQEAECLQRFAGNGAPFLLKFDPHSGAMLLERIRPGTDVQDLEEEVAIEACISVMKQLHTAPLLDAQLPTVQDWWMGFERYRKLYPGSAGPLPENLLIQAEGLYSDLVKSMETSVLLHGDLHHGNVLIGTRLPNIAIDPQGVIGEPAYEVGAFLRNPLPELIARDDLDAVLDTRVGVFSALMNIDKERVASWGFSQAVLSAIWMVEEHGSGWEGTIEIASALYKLSST